jgi:hypothetical protein
MHRTDLAFRQARRFSLWMNSTAEQSFRCVDVAETGNTPLVHQEQLNRQSGTCK